MGGRGSVSDLQSSVEIPVQNRNLSAGYTGTFRGILYHYTSEDTASVIANSSLQNMEGSRYELAGGINFAPNLVSWARFDRGGIVVVKTSGLHVVSSSLIGEIAQKVNSEAFENYRRAIQLYGFQSTETKQAATLMEPLALNAEVSRRVVSKGGDAYINQDNALIVFNRKKLRLIYAGSSKSLLR